MKLTFDDWMHKVDEACYRLYGLSVHDLPDCCFRDWYEDGMAPATAARKVMKSVD